MAKNKILGNIITGLKGFGLTMISLLALAMVSVAVTALLSGVGGISDAAGRTASIIVGVLALPAAFFIWGWMAQELFRWR